mmetsp:Transcript_32019/g.57334  ORF Transcript_32019/g.57334 Transcript_32019/m.57334 type:complete len:286 (+) Transcript_32019:2-859(+)
MLWTSSPTTLCGETCGACGPLMPPRPGILRPEAATWSSLSLTPASTTTIPISAITCGLTPRRFPTTASMMTEMVSWTTCTVLTPSRILVILWTIKLELGTALTAPEPSGPRATTTRASRVSRTKCLLWRSNFWVPMVPGRPPARLCVLIMRSSTVPVFRQTRGEAAAVTPSSRQRFRTPRRTTTTCSSPPQATTQATTTAAVITRRIMCLLPMPLLPSRPPLVATSFPASPTSAQQLSIWAPPAVVSCRAAPLLPAAVTNIFQAPPWPHPTSPVPRLCSSPRIPP